VALGCRGVSRADFRRDERIEGTGGFFWLEVNTNPARHNRDVIGPELASVCGHNFDELVQWMVQDASLDRRDRRGPELT
jgi:D-alanine-D-alanine ligase